MNKITKKEIAKTIKDIKKLVKPNDTIYCFNRHTSQSGMMRRISFYVVKKNKLISLDWYIARITSYSHDRNRGGLIVNGCGMDMGFSVVYELGSTLWPKGTPKPHGTRNGEPDRKGGYALKHSWMY
jgi:hypothetical protein